MGLFDFIRRGSKNAAAPVAHAPHRAESPAAPNNAPDLAREISQDIVRQLIALERVDLDYTPMSLTTVDQILDRCSARGMRSATQQGLVLGLGCYFGEILRRHARGQWVFHKDTPLPPLPMYPPNYLHLMIPNTDGDQYINVFKRIVDRLDGDRGMSIAAYYKGITSLISKKTSPPRSNPA